jgi:hypothetical protein
MKATTMYQPYINKIFVLITSFLMLLLPVAALAFTGKVSYTNGMPAAGALVNLLIDGKDMSSVRCDSTGRFSLAELPAESAIIQIKAPDGKDFASVNLPAKMFVKGETSIVLQPR